MPGNKSSSRGKRSRQYFHRAARRCNKLGAIVEGGIGSEEDHDDGDCSDNQPLDQQPQEERDDHAQAAGAPITIRCKLSGPEHKARLKTMKDQITSQLKQAGGDLSETPSTTKELMDRLCDLYDPKSFDPKQFMTPVTMTDTKLEDMWLMISKPQFKDCLGKNKNGDDMYTLGRMAFDMFRPTQLVCSIQGSFNEINIVDGTDEEAVKHVPKALEADVREGKIPVRTYNIITAFTIEPYDPETMGPNSPNKGIAEPILAIMTTNGYAMPYPRQNNRYSIWFSGGSIQLVSDPTTTPNNEGGQWEQIFSAKTMPQRTLTEKVGVFAAGLLLGATSNEEMDADGKMSFVMKRPMTAYIDLLYLDDTMRIMRSSSGAIYVMIRAPALDDTFSSLYNSTSGSLISGESDCSSLTMGSDLVASSGEGRGGEGGLGGSSNSLALTPPRRRTTSLTPPRRTMSPTTTTRPTAVDDHLPKRPRRRDSIEVEEVDMKAIEAFANSVVPDAPVLVRSTNDGQPPQRPKRCSSPLDTPPERKHRLTGGGPPRCPLRLDDDDNQDGGPPIIDCLPKRPTRRSSIDRPIPIVVPTRFGTPTKHHSQKAPPSRGRLLVGNTNNNSYKLSAAPPSRPRRTYSPARSMSPPRLLHRDVATSA